MSPKFSTDYNLAIGLKLGFSNGHNFLIIAYNKWITHWWVCLYFRYLRSNFILTFVYVPFGWRFKKP